MENLLKLSALDVILIWIALVSLSWFIYSSIELRKLHKKLKRNRHQEDKKWREIEEKAQEDYQEVLKAANEKAEEIIQNSTKISFDISTSLRQTIDSALVSYKTNIEDTSLSLTNKYAGELEEINKHNIQLLTNVYKDIEVDAKTHFEQYQKLLEQQSFEAEKQAKLRIEEQYAKLQKELEAVRESKIAELGNKVNRLVLTIAKDVIGKSLDGATQTELITQSLDKAKKEGAI